MNVTSTASLAPTSSEQVGIGGHDSYPVHYLAQLLEPFRPSSSEARDAAQE